MGIGLLVGAFALGAFAAHSVAKNRNERSTENYGVRVNYAPAPVRTIICQSVPVRAITHRTTEFNEKVEFFDNYRALDVKLARLIGQGSGGIGLLINACRYQGLNINSLNNLIKDLRAARDYRNILAHNRKRWKELSNPNHNFSTVLNRVETIVNKNVNYVAKKMYAAANHKKQTRR